MQGERLCRRSGCAGRAAVQEERMFSGHHITKRKDPGERLLIQEAEQAATKLGVDVEAAPAVEEVSSPWSSTLPLPWQDLGILCKK